jgi:hypothetical protein
VNNGVNNRPQVNAGQPRPMESGHVSGPPNANGSNNGSRPPVNNQKNNPGNGGGQNAHGTPAHRPEKPEGKEK